MLPSTTAPTIVAIGKSIPEFRGTDFVVSARATRVRLWCLAESR